MRATPFRYEYPSKEPSYPCVFKMWFGKKFMIWKGKALLQALDNAAIQIDREIRRQGGPDERNAFSKAVAYIKKARITYFTVEIMLQSDKPVALLRSEYLLLKKHFSSDDCLNVSKDPYIPAWIPSDDIKKFDQWKSSLNKPKKNAATKNNKNISARKSAKKKCVI